MGFAVIPVKPGGGYRFAQHGLAESHAGQRYRVEGAERVERVAFMAGTAHRRVDKAQIKRGVMANQDRTLAAVASCSSADGYKDTIKRGAFVERAAKRVIDHDAGDFQRSRVDFRTGERLDMGRYQLTRNQITLAIDFDQLRRNFQQGVALALKAAGDRKSTRLKSSHKSTTRMPSSACKKKIKTT